MTKKIIIGLLVGAVLALGASGLIYYYTSPQDSMTMSSQGFFDTIFRNVGLPRNYISSPQFSTCTPTGDTFVCHQHGTITDTKNNSLYGIYFGGAHNIKDVNAITNEIDFLGYITATGTQILQGDPSVAYAYITEHRDDFAWHVLPYQGGRDLLEGWKSSQHSIDTGALQLPGVTRTVPGVPFVLQAESGYSFIITPPYPGAIHGFGLKKDSCINDANCLQMTDVDCGVYIYSGGTAPTYDRSSLTGGDGRKELMSKTMSTGGYDILVDGTKESCSTVTVRLLHDDISLPHDQIKILYNGADLVTGVMLGSDYIPSNLLDPSLVGSLSHALVRNGNFICLAGGNKGDSIEKLTTERNNQKTMKNIGCIELLSDTSVIRQGLIDDDRDGAFDTMVSMKTLARSNQKYLEYNCEGCAPGADFSWVGYLSVE